MKIRALKKFEGIKDKERNVYPKEGDIWEVSEERAEFLKSHGVIEYVEEKDIFEKYEEQIIEEKPKTVLKKKTTKKKKNKKED